MSAYSPTATDRYKGAAVQTATPVDLFLLLCQRAVRDIDEALAAAKQGDARAEARALSHARAVVMELMSGLDRERGGSVAESLAALYVFAAMHLHPPAEPAQLGAVREVLGSLIEAYCSIRSGGAPR